MYRKRIAWGLVFAIALGFWFSVTPVTLADTMEDEVLAVAQQYGQAFNTGDFELMASLWWQSEEITHFYGEEPFRQDGWSQVGEFYGSVLNFFAQLPPGSVSLSFRQPRVTLLGDDVAIFTDHWVFSLQIPGGPQETAAGRATGVYQKIEGKWLIVHLHISVLPEPPG
ncbi:MAG: YybH family protein [Candidatus Bipolaricaulia bacterium]